MVYPADAQGNSRELWRDLDRVMGKTTSVNEYVHTTDNFADFFASKIAAIRLETANAPPPVYAATPPAVLSGFADVHVSHVVELIASAPCKNCEVDPLPTWLLKQCSNILAPYLASLFNLSLNTAIFPSGMKRAIVVPLLKKDNLSIDEVKKYKPVSNLSFISKLLERVVSAQINGYLESHDLLPPRQSAYRVGHSCETALMRIHSNLISRFYSGQRSLDEIACKQNNKHVLLPTAPAQIDLTFVTDRGYLVTGKRTFFLDVTFRMDYSRELRNGRSTHCRVFSMHLPSSSMEGFGATKYLLYNP